MSSGEADAIKYQPTVVGSITFEGIIAKMAKGNFNPCLHDPFTTYTILPEQRDFLALVLRWTNPNNLHLEEKRIFEDLKKIFLKS